jgi:hypothetical protein
MQAKSEPDESDEEKVVSNITRPNGDGLQPVPDQEQTELDLVDTQVKGCFDREEAGGYGWEQRGAPGALKPSQAFDDPAKAKRTH